MLRIKAQTFEILVITHRRKIHSLQMETTCFEAIPEGNGSHSAVVLRTSEAITVL
jgi:hypothetical protein